MQRFHVFVLALLLALPIIASAQIQVPPADELGAIAWSVMQDRANEQALPTRLSSSVARTIHVAAPGGTLSVTFGASAGDGSWMLQSYAWRHDRSDEEKGAAAVPGASTSGTSGSGAPENPDPNPPGYHGTPGDTARNSFRLGNWRYTVRYTYGVRDGVLGWHVDSIEATDDPTPPPGPIDEQEK